MNTFEPVVAYVAASFPSSKIEFWAKEAVPNKDPVNPPDDMTEPDTPTLPVIEVELDILKVVDKILVDSPSNRFIPLNSLLPERYVFPPSTSKVVTGYAIT